MNNLTMQQPGRVLNSRFYCWGRDCIFTFNASRYFSGVSYEDSDDAFLPEGAKPLEGILKLNDFVWSIKEKLFLVPKKHAEEIRKGFYRRNDEERERLNQGAKPLPIPKVLIHADERLIRARCPLCEKVSILCYSSNGTPLSDAGRERQKNRGLIPP